MVVSNYNLEHSFSRKDNHFVTPGVQCHKKYKDSKDQNKIIFL